MPTITESLTNATAELKVASLALQSVETSYRQMLTEKTNAAQVAIDTFTQANEFQYFVDPAGLSGGSDNNAGTSYDKPFRTIEKALDSIEGNGKAFFGAVIWLLSDGAVITKFRTIRCNINIFGVQWGSDIPGALYRNAVRTLSFLSEAANSPVLGLGLTVPSIELRGQILRLSSLSIMLPDVQGTLSRNNLFGIVDGGSVSIENTQINAASASTKARLFSVAAPATFAIYATLGSNMPGKLFSGIAAGNDPNSSFKYRTNITSA